MTRIEFNIEIDALQLLFHVYIQIMCMRVCTIETNKCLEWFFFEIL